MASKLYELISYTTTKAMGIIAPNELKNLHISCVSQALSVFPNMISRLYIDNLFNRQAIEDMRDFVNDLKEAFNQLLQENQWMDSTTKANAISKLNAISVNIASPNIIFNDEEFEVYSNDVRI